MSSVENPNEFQEYIDECVKSSFVSFDWSAADNQVLRGERKDWNALGSHYYPAVVINQKTLRGHLTPNNVFEALCAGFKYEPYECRQFQDKEDIPLPFY